MTTGERLATIEEQLKQNVKEHSVILERVNHNCDLNQKRFDGIEGKLDDFMEIVSNRYAKVDEVKVIDARQWKILVSIASFGISAIIGLFIFLLKGHISF